MQEEEKFLIDLSVASAVPFERYDEAREEFYFERLIIEESAVNLERLRGGASILKNHDPDHILGVVRKAWITAGKLYITAEFRQNDPESVAVYKDAKAGTLPNVSIGYVVNSWEPVKESGLNYRNIVAWMPYEVSVAVGVPADSTVGFYRSFNHKQSTKEKVSMTFKERSDEPAAASDNAVEKPSECQEKSCRECANQEDCPAATPEETRAAEDTGPGAEASAPAQEDLERSVFSAVKKMLGKSVRSFNIPEKGFSPVRAEKYSYARAFQAMLNPAKNCFEREISCDLYRTSGLDQSEGGLMLPFTRDLFSALTKREFPGEGGFVDASGSGAGLSANENRPDLFVEYIRNKIGVKNATFLYGLTGFKSLTFPVQTGTGSVDWIDGLNADNGISSPTVSNITLAPKKLGAYTAVGKDLILSGNPSAVNIAINDLLALIAQKLAYTMLKGRAAGSTRAAITGVDTATGVQTVTVSDISSVTWGKMLEFAAKLEGKAFTGALEFIMSAADKGILKGVTKDTGSGRFIVEDNELDGYPVTVDGNLVTGELFFGDFSNIIVGQWGGIEITLDPYKYLRSGGVEVNASLAADIAVRNPQCFVKMIKPAATT